MKGKKYKVSIDKIPDNAVLAKSVINSATGRIIVPEGVEITASIETKLRNQDIKEIEIYELNKIELETSGQEDSDIEEVLADASSSVLDLESSFSEAEVTAKKIYNESINNAKLIISNLTAQEKYDPELVKDTIGNILDKIFTHKNILLNLLSIEDQAEYLYNHLVNVSIVNILLGIEMKLDGEQIEELGIVGFLHDIGMIKVDKNILNLPRQLTREEFAAIKKHPFYSMAFINNSNSFNDQIAKAVYQHHEQPSGAGYPKGRTEEEIKLYAKITAVSDSYIAMISNKHYAKKKHPVDAVRELIQYSGIRYSKEVVQTFLKTFSMYPVGTVIKINTGDIARVIEADTIPFRPKIQLLYDKEQNKYEHLKIIALKNHRELYIKEVLEDF